MSEDSIKQDSNKFQTSDLGLATFLKIKGAVPEIKGKRNRRVFIYNKNDIIIKLITGWFNNEGNHLNYYNNLRNLKSQVINMEE